MRHKFMEGMTRRLAARGIAVLRYQFPYMERRAKRPDPESVLLDTVRAAITTGRKCSGGLPLFAGGKSMGGRMASLVAARDRPEDVRGLIFFGYPLHRAGRPSGDRSRHLSEIQTPMLFLQGSRDALADLKLLQPVCAGLGKRAELFVLEGGDHSFRMPKSAGRSDEEALDTAAAKTASWIAAVLARSR